MRSTHGVMTYMAVAAAAVAAAACSPAESRPPVSESTVSVEAVQARYGGLPLRERLTGSVRALGQVAIYPEASGPIVAVLARNGQVSEAGDPLVRIRAEVSRNHLQQSEAGLESARAQRDRAQANVDDLERRFERSVRGRRELHQPGGTRDSSHRTRDGSCRIGGRRRPGPGGRGRSRREPRIGAPDDRAGPDRRYRGTPQRRGRSVRDR